MARRNEMTSLNETRRDEIESVLQKHLHFLTGNATSYRRKNAWRKLTPLFAEPEALQHAIKIFREAYAWTAGPNRTDAAAFLAASGEREALSELTEAALFGDGDAEDDKRRDAAVHNLVKFQPEFALQKFSRELGSGTHMRQMRAAEALAQHPGKEAVEVLGEAALFSDPHTAVYSLVGLEGALEKKHSKRALALVACALGHRKDDVFEQAAMMLSRKIAEKIALNRLFRFKSSRKAPSVEEIESAAKKLLPQKVDYNAFQVFSEKLHKHPNVFIYHVAQSLKDAAVGR